MARSGRGCSGPTRRSSPAWRPGADVGAAIHGPLSDLLFRPRRRACVERGVTVARYLPTAEEHRVDLPHVADVAGGIAARDHEVCELTRLEAADLFLAIDGRRRAERAGGDGLERSPARPHQRFELDVDGLVESRERGAGVGADDHANARLPQARGVLLADG